MAKSPGIDLQSAAAVGSTTTTTIQITSKAGAIFSAQVYDCINVGTDGELRSQLLEGSLNEVLCPYDKGTTYRLALPVAYHDADLQLFALVIPEALRHEELRLRRTLLEKMEASTGVLPAYVRNFAVVFGAEGLQTLEEERVHSAMAGPDETTAISGPPEMTSSEEARKREEALAIREAELKKESAELARAREQLDEERRKLQVMELNLEQERLRMQQASDDPVEHTQVVTDDQFIEIVGDVAPAASSLAPALAPSESDSIPTNFNDVAESAEGRFVLSRNDLVIVGYAMDDARAETFLGEHRRFYQQLQRVDGVPVVALTLVAFDAARTCVDAVAAGLVEVDKLDGALLEQIEKGKDVHVAIYGDGGDLVTAWEATPPGRENLRFAREQLRSWQGGVGARAGELAARAKQALQAGGVDFWGQMEHPFQEQSFLELRGAAETQLATGIVGYWSTEAQIEYLVGVRAFPLSAFREIQKRVVRQALHWGIALPDALIDVAIQAAIIPDRLSLAQRLLVNYTEVCVGLRPNDLDPLQQWDNWDGLIALCEAAGVSLDPDMVELAEASFKRAGEYEEMLEAEEEILEEEPAPAVEVDGLVVARRSEVTGVTYFLPDEAVMDSFDDLASLERDDLVRLLNDANGRLEAAQMLIERFGTEHLAEVLQAAESLNAAQLTALSRFIEARADGLEAALMQVLEFSGPAATLIAARALAALSSTGALPKLLDAACDPARRGRNRALAQALAGYGEKLLPPLTRALKRDPEDADLLAVLFSLEEARPGTLGELARDRSKELQTAARLARELV